MKPLGLGWTLCNFAPESASMSQRHLRLVAVKEPHIFERGVYEIWNFGQNPRIFRDHCTALLGQREHAQDATDSLVPIDKVAEQILSGGRVLGCFPLGVHRYIAPMTIAEQPRTRKQALNVRDLAEIIQVEEGTVRKHIRQGHIPYFRVGMILRFDPSDISDWLEGNSLSPRVRKTGATKRSG